MSSFSETRTNARFGSDATRDPFPTGRSLLLLLAASASLACSATGSSAPRSQGGGGAGNAGGDPILFPGRGAGGSGASSNNPPPVITNATPFVVDDTGNSGLGPDVISKLKAGGGACSFDILYPY